MHSGFRSRRPRKFSRFIQLSNNAGGQIPTRFADGHTGSHDEYDMGLCRRMCKLLRIQDKIVVIVIICSGGSGHDRAFGSRHDGGCRFPVVRTQGRNFALRKPAAKSKWHWAVSPARMWGRRSRLPIPVSRVPIRFTLSFAFKRHSNVADQ